MSEINKAEYSHLGINIENMLEEIINSDDELDNNQKKSSLKFNDNNPYLKDAKENINHLLYKDIFSNAFSHIDKKIKNKPNNPKIDHNFEIINSSGLMNQPDSNNLNININNDYNQHYFTNFSSNINSNININKFNNINDSFNIMSNSNNMNLKINQNLLTNDKANYSNNNNYLNNSESMNSTLLSNNNVKNSTFSDNKSFISIHNNYFNCNNYINYQNFCYSHFKGNKINKPQRNRKNQNSFFAGNKIIFNPKILNYNNNQKYIRVKKNVEMEILLIETYKILNKFEKISQNCYNKLKGKFVQIIRTHKGSRLFQNYLKSTKIEILHQIFLEIKYKLSDLLKDNYANYFCKKLFDCLNQKDRIEYLTIIQNDLCILAIDVTATYPIQDIIEQLGSIAEKNIIYLGIKDHIDIFCYNIYGAYVIEKILSYFEDKFI